MVSLILMIMEEQIKDLYINAVVNEMSPDEFYNQWKTTIPDDLKKKINKKDLINELHREVMDLNGVTTIQLRNFKSRKKELVTVRQWHIFMLVRLGKLSLTQAGMTYKKDHATALHAIKSICNLREVDKNFQYIYEEVIARLEKEDNKIFVLERSLTRNSGRKIIASVKIKN